MKAKIKANELTKPCVLIYNEFVDTCNENNLIFDSLNVRVGKSKEGVKGLSFEMKLPFGLEQEKANQIFNAFIKNHPECSLSFNLPEQSDLEKMLRSKSQTFIAVEGGFRLDRI